MAAPLGSATPAVRAALRRLEAKGQVADPYRGFHVIVPPEYRRLGCLPAAQFVPQLMEHLGEPYYAALLSAAELHGAAHQRPQAFQVMVKRNRRPIESGTVRVQFIARKDMEHASVVEKKAPRGSPRISSPEATGVSAHRGWPTARWTRTSSSRERSSDTRLPRSCERSARVAARACGKLRGVNYHFSLLSEDALRAFRDLVLPLASVTVLFADIVGFTPLASTLAPERVVELLNQMFTRFDELAARHRVEKIKTIGDAYMVVAGLPEPRADHADAAAQMALDLRDATAEMSRTLGHPLQVRIGLCSGPAVAGVIGIRKFAYDLWGDTVNTAARMEAHGAPGEIQVTESTYRLLRDRYTLAERGVIEVKGKGPMRTYYLRGAAGRAEPPTA